MTVDDVLAHISINYLLPLPFTCCLQVEVYNCGCFRLVAEDIRHVENDNELTYLYFHVYILIFTYILIFSCLQS